MEKLVDVPTAVQEMVWATHPSRFSPPLGELIVMVWAFRAPKRPIMTTSNILRRICMSNNYVVFSVLRGKTGINNRCLFPMDRKDAAKIGTELAKTKKCGYLNLDGKPAVYAIGALFIYRF